MPQAATATKTTDQEWIILAEVCRRTSLSVWHARNLAFLGRIKTRLLPGMRPLYSAADVARIAAEMGK
jgi:hypothetical protein